MDTTHNETYILQLGTELFKAIKAPQKNLFSKKWWYGRLMQWTLTNPAFKTPLFRFVDVFPSLNKKEDIPFFLNDYFKENTKNKDGPYQTGQESLFSRGSDKISITPSFLSKSMALLPPPLLRSFISKQMTEMARLFIIGENLPSILPTLEQMRKNNSAFTLDLLGEATLSEKEAHTYQNYYLNMINQLYDQAKHWTPHSIIDENENGEPIPKVNISVKISSLDSQIFTVSWEESKKRIKNKLRALFKKAIDTNTFINIDMEQYEYKNLILEIFKELISEPQFKNYPHFGIVIQAYLKEAFNDLKDLSQFIKQHPSPVHIRLVKGAYWDYEFIYTKQQNWPCPVFLNKWESDLQFETCAKLILNSYPHLRLSIGSHNIRSITYALSLSQALRIPKKAIEIQTLYGMAPSINTQLIKKGWRVRQYCPIGTPIPGMAYLVRRLLENTANESFMRSWGNYNIEDLLKPPKKEDKATLSSLKAIVKNISKAPYASYKKPDYTSPSSEKAALFSQSKQVQSGEFINTPILDFSIAIHRQNFQAAIKEWQKILPLNIPILINNKTKTSQEKIKRENPSHPSQTIAFTSQADKAHCDQAVKLALQQFPLWSQTPVSERCKLLVSLADKMETHRYSLATLQVLEVGKNWKAADADVCEAIDFCRYYAQEMSRLEKPKLTDSVWGEESFYSWQARGLALVIAPWNFPLAILTGMTVACLVTGNTVLIKPAEQSSATAYELMKLLIECGLPAGVAQFLPGKGEETGAYLVEQKETELIAFTGSKKVGCSILEKANQVSLRQNKLKKCIIEMGGKNAIIVDDSADLDIAVAGVLESAFEFQGQKCSACSRVLVEETIETLFTERLISAMESLIIGSAEKPESRIGPVIDSQAVKKINSYIEKGKQSTRLISKELNCPQEGYFISPVLFSQVPPDSSLLKEEIFGPVLVLISFKNLEEAIQIANNTEFALTGGFYSRSPSRIELVKQKFQVGNLYINRNCTGAIVKRHPFGGFKMSGLGHKAGGPDYLIQFMNPKVITENTVRRGGFSPHLFT
ncbi:MAG: proline dehydrogenase family protein [Bdellovibrionales bacterium]|nr:proline dehydrogenase family protein [Bdellovibrionales bacterium]